MPGQSSSTTAEQSAPTINRRPWSRGRLIGQKPPLKMREVWAIRTRFQLANRLRDLALFNVAIDSKLRGCDIVALRVDDVELSGRVRPRTTVLQKKTGRPVQFEIMEQTRSAVQDWISRADRKPGDYLFPSRDKKDKPLGTRHYARLVDGWVSSIGLDPALYGTHSLRRTKVALICRRTGNLRAVQLLLRRATYCPRTSGRRADLLSVPSAMRRDGADQATARVPRRWAGGHRAARQLTRLHSGVDDARVGSSIHGQ
jgi:integrase